MLAAVSGFDVTGMPMSRHKASAYIVQFYLATYRAALHRGEPHFSQHGPAVAQMTRGWQRIVLPLADATGAIQRFLGGAVPIGHDGMPIRPIM